jgi:two-component system, NarL family, sensor histidine kinase DegS
MKLNLESVKASLKTALKTAPGLLDNPHFWIILILIGCLSYLYYIPFPALGLQPPGLWRFRLVEFTDGLTGSLFYIPFIYAANVFGWVGLLVTWIISIVILMPLILYYTYSSATLLTNIMFLTVPIIVGLLVIFFVKWRNRERKIFYERAVERQEYVSLVLKAQENERKRLAQEIHDDTIQTLLAIANRMQYVINKEGSKLTPEIIKQIEIYNNSIFRVSEDLRKISLDLRPSILDNIGLVEAVRWLVDDLYEKGVNAKVITTGEIRKLPSESDVHVFRFIQEGLNNVRRHAEASEVVVQMEYSPDFIKVSVQDNGKGFILPEHLGKFSVIGKMGVLGMHNRARMLKGEFKINSEPGKGTTVSVTFKP